MRRPELYGGMTRLETRLDLEVTFVVFAAPDAFAFTAGSPGRLGTMSWTFSDSVESPDPKGSQFTLRSRTPLFAWHLDMTPPDGSTARTTFREVTAYGEDGLSKRAARSPAAKNLEAGIGPGGERGSLNGRTQVGLQNANIQTKGEGGGRMLATKEETSVSRKPWPAHIGTWQTVLAEWLAGGPRKPGAKVAKKIVDPFNAKVGVFEGEVTGALTSDAPASPSQVTLQVSVRFDGGRSIQFTILAEYAGDAEVAGPPARLRWIRYSLGQMPNAVSEEETRVVEERTFSEFQRLLAAGKDGETVVETERKLKKAPDRKCSG